MYDYTQFHMWILLLLAQNEHNSQYDVFRFRSASEHSEDSMLAERAIINTCRPTRGSLANCYVSGLYMPSRCYRAPASILELLLVDNMFCSLLSVDVVCKHVEWRHWEWCSFSYTLFIQFYTALLNYTPRGSLHASVGPWHRWIPNP